MKGDREAQASAWGTARSALSSGLPFTALSGALRSMSAEWDFDEAQALATYCLEGAPSLPDLPDLTEWAADEPRLLALRDMFLWWDAAEDGLGPKSEAYLMSAPILRFALLLDEDPTLRLILSRMPSKREEYGDALILTNQTSSLHAEFQWYRSRGVITRSFSAATPSPGSKAKLQGGSRWTFELRGRVLGGGKPFRTKLSDDPFELVDDVLRDLRALALRSSEK